MKKNLRLLLIGFVVLMAGIIYYTQKRNTGNDLIMKDSVFLSMRGYGYDIIINGAVMIHQSSIPGIAGTSGFASAEDARKIARLAISKIMNNQLPPVISLEDLQTSGIFIYDYESRTGLYKADM